MEQMTLVVIFNNGEEREYMARRARKKGRWVWNDNAEEECFCLEDIKQMVLETKPCLVLADSPAAAL